MAACSSTLVGSGNVLVGPATAGRKRSSPSMVPVPSPPTTTGRRRSMKGVEAVVAAPREAVSSPAPTLLPLYWDQTSAAAEVFDYKTKIEEEEEEEKRNKGSVTADDMDRWISESIGEIVRNIGEAPFLIEIFSQGPSALRLEREDASPESWPLVKKKWGKNSQTPDGIILVEELKDTDEEEEGGSDSQSEGDCSRTWGMVVQGRGMDCAAPCYILNTCRVRSSAGFCTHFCLVRAKCFGETIDKQLGKAWLHGR